MELIVMDVPSNKWSMRKEKAAWTRARGAGAGVEMRLNNGVVIRTLERAADDDARWP